MRFLNKVVFINSASISYAEVDLDGNVHLIGTQGAGKSTLLRAILFFYNADKTKLGIPREKKGFDEYYFPYQNSYIVFEVEKENSKFCVLAFKSQARTCFRFIDAAYQKELFIDSLNDARDWASIRNALGSRIGYSKVVNSYEEYRNIVYGNNKGLPSNFRQYAVLESAQYQNIPRTIQNVFLNSKLEAEFIKATIIKSINEDELSIDLTTYSKGHLREFELELNDVKKWKKRDKAGVSILEKQARGVVDTSIKYKTEQQEKKRLAASLGWVLDKNDRYKPDLAQKIDAATQAQQTLEQEINTARQEFKTVESKVKGRQAVIDNELKKAAKKRAEYESMDIEQIILRVNNKAAQLTKQAQLQAQRDILTSKFKKIEDKYQALIKQKENERATLKNNKDRKQNEINAHFLDVQDELKTKYEYLIEEARQQGQQMIADTQNMLDTQRELVRDLTVKKSEVKNTQFFAEELDLHQKELNSLQNERVTAKQTIANSQTKIEHLRKEWALEIKTHENETAVEISRIKHIQQWLEEDKKLIETKVDDVTSSLYGWLEENKPGWQKNIGKVIDEDLILFAKHLEPRLSNANQQGFYGVEINLNKIDKQVKSVDDHKRELAKVEQQIQDFIKQINQLSKILQGHKDRLHKKYQTEIKKTNQLITQNEHTAEQTAEKIKAAEVAQYELRQKAANVKATAINQAEKEENQAKAEEDKIKHTLAELKQAQAKAIANKREAKMQELAEITQQKESKQKQLQGTFDQDSALITQAIEGLNAEKSQALQSEGANTKRINVIDQQLAEVAKELDFIEANHARVIEYNKDKKELFDKEGELQDEKQQLDENLQQESAKHQLQLESLKRRLNEIKTKLAELYNDQNLITEDEKAYEKFKKWSGYLDISEQIAGFTKEHANPKRGTELMHLIQLKHQEEQQLLNVLSGAIHTFTGNFDEKNVFSFKVRFNPQDYQALLDFAADLEEFTNENKIATYEKRINDRFANIITQIGTEVGKLTSKGAEIRKIISKINSDFASNKIFVKAIKHIEMKIIDSDHKIMRTMVEIKEFNDTKGLELGAPNLFSGNNAQQDNQKAINLLTRLVKELSNNKSDQLKLSDSFDLRFKIIENDNDSGWVQKLANVGSEGTDILAKAMINITLLNVFKDSASRRFKDFKLHCMMDEIGKLHPNNVAGILKFANQRNILLINGSPTSYNAIDYKYTYLLSKDNKNITSVSPLIRQKH